MEKMKKNFLKGEKKIRLCEVKFMGVGQEGFS